MCQEESSQSAESTTSEQITVLASLEALRYICIVYWTQAKPHSSPTIHACSLGSLHVAQRLAGLIPVCTLEKIQNAHIVFSKSRQVHAGTDVLGFITLQVAARFFSQLPVTRVL